jgi:hypothetical protein
MSKSRLLQRWQTQYAQWVLVEGKTSKNFFKSALKIKKKIQKRFNEIPKYFKVLQIIPKKYQNLFSMF